VNNRVALPPQLFSHNDQQNFVMSLQATKPQQGWASRMAELMMDVNGNNQLSMNISLSGANTFQMGGAIAPYAMSAGGVTEYWSIRPQSTEPWDIDRVAAFFVGIGDYDTHGDQNNRYPVLMRELNHSLNSFYNALVEMGVSDKVTTFTASDFGRTLTSNGDGTDHGWGSHQMIMGDAIDGGKFFGNMPDLAIGSSDDIGEGRIIPTTSMDQYAASLASWYGLTPSQVSETFPNLANFNEQTLGLFT
jgi:uncharacterized protein (DUF1501 family)